MTKVNVLIACEESQVECKAFRDAGFNAFSCDIQYPHKKANTAWHIVGDVTPLLQGQTTFRTMDNRTHRLEKWHLIIAHPPCTYLCKVGSVWLHQGGKVDPERLAKMEAARDFFMLCYNALADYVVVENPLPMARARLPKPSCYVQPFWYGHPYSKKTLYWLKGLPPLLPENMVANYKEFVRSSRGKYRSRSFAGIAAAMVHQWGQFILDELNK